MKKINVLLVSLLICIASIDILWFFFPELTLRRYALMLPIPVIILCYFLRVEVKNILYLSALTAFMIGDYFFIIGEELEKGIASSAVGLSIYGVIVLKQSHYISTRRLLINTIPFLLIYTVPFIFFIDQINDDIFGEVVFYTFAVGSFSFMSILAYVSKKNAVTQKLLLAGISTVCMGIAYGIYLFMGFNSIYNVLANTLFMYSNYKMWQYVIIKDSTTNEGEKESITL
ncbi:hypothetical protein [uncultured Kordia sp.]|uniref:hypothetical protein n=1 Tax=uncultured Kordia sp. TaxID=507699 RepID=UPI0026356C7E|nr:hypothetical protein [uncultured Kordia sp.]